MADDNYRVKINEDFGPVPNYKPYLMLYTALMGVAVWLLIFVWFLIPIFNNDPEAEGIKQWYPYSFILLAVAIALPLIWAQLYVKTVQYHLNETEVSWKRGVWFHTTGIVPYNRITDISINQGPIMRLFKISHLKIQTAGGGTAKGVPEIQIEGQIFAEELRAYIMDYVRGSKNAGGATIGVAEPEKKNVVSNDELLAEVREIRKLLEKKE